MFQQLFPFRINSARVMFDEVKANNGFHATTTHVSLLYQLINSIEPFGDYCYVDISNNGLCFSMTDNNICKIILNLDKKLFSKWEFKINEKIEHAKERNDGIINDDNATDISDTGDSDNNSNDGDDDDDDDDDDTSSIMTVNLDLKSFLETINIHVKEREINDTETNCTLSYKCDGEPFVLIFEDEQIIERCEISTFFVDPLLQTNIVNGKKEKKKKDKRKNKNKKQMSDKDDLFLKVNEDNFTDDSVFQLDAFKSIYDIVLKSSILYDVIKDMHDSSTIDFIIYCIKREKAFNHKDKSELIFISKSKIDSIGYSKLIIPQRKSTIQEFEIYKPKSFNNNTGDNFNFNSKNINDNSTNNIQMEKCSNVSVSSIYHFDYFSKLIKAIKLSRLIKIRKDLNGLTSLLLLLGSSKTDQYKSLLFGTTIEFVTLESISIDEEFENERNKFGYQNKNIEKLIKDDDEINTIRIGEDGQLITLDDYFNDNNNEFESLEIERARKEVDQYHEIGNGIVPTEEENRVLEITEQLTMSVLGKNINQNHQNRNEVQIDRTINESVNQEECEINSKKRKAKEAENKVKTRNKTKKKNKKKENEGIETVGGAIEIPLFI